MPWGSVGGTQTDPNQKEKYTYIACWVVLKGNWKFLKGKFCSVFLGKIKTLRGRTLVGKTRQVSKNDPGWDLAFGIGGSWEKKGRNQNE